MICRIFGGDCEGIRVSNGGSEGVGVDLRDAHVGHSVVYEFDVELDNKVLPFKLLEDVDHLDYVDLPIFRVRDKNGLVQKGKLASGKVGILGKTKVFFLTFL